MKKLLYIHGLGSGANSHTSKALRESLRNVEVYAPEIPQDPTEAYNFLVEFYRKNVPDIIVGSSLGGFYASLIGGCYKILINPAPVPHESIRNALGLGNYEYFSERSDGREFYTLTEDFYRKLEELYHHFYSECIDEEFRYETYAIIGLNDSLLDSRASVNTFINNYPKEHLIEDVNLNHRPTDDEIRRRRRNRLWPCRDYRWCSQRVVLTVTL